MKKYLVIALAGLLCASAVQAELAIVATRTDTIGGESSLVVFNTDGTLRYLGPTESQYALNALDIGTFQADPVTSQVIVSGWDNASGFQTGNSVARAYKLDLTSATALFQVTYSNRVFTDVTTAQLDTDALDEYAVTRGEMYDSGSGPLIPYAKIIAYDDSGGGVILSASARNKWWPSAIDAGDMDGDGIDEIVYSRFTSSAFNPAYGNESEVVAIWMDGTQIDSSNVVAHWASSQDMVMADWSGNGRPGPIMAANSAEPDGVWLDGVHATFAWDNTTKTTGWGAYDHIAGFLGRSDNLPITAIAAGNIDDDPNDEFVVVAPRAEWFNAGAGGDVEEVEFLLYDHDGTKLTDSRNPWWIESTFNSITMADLDGDGIDEIIVGHQYDKETGVGNRSHILIYNVATGNMASWEPETWGADYVVGTLTDIAVIDLVPEPVSLLLLLSGTLLAIRRRK